VLNTAPPQLPAAVAGAVTSIVGLDTQAVAHSQRADVSPTPATSPRAEAQQAVAAGAPTPCTAAGQAGSAQTGYTADQLAKAYDLNPLYAAGDRGAGVTVAVFELASFQASDIVAYQACYGTSAALNTVSVDGGPTSASGRIEVELDIEGVIGLAPSSAVTDYQAPNTGKGALDAYQRIATDDTAKAVSTSWGNCDPVVSAGTVAAEATIFAEMAAQGQSMFAATGDNGSEDCSGNTHGSTGLFTDDPASQPNVTGVGGTTLTGLGAAPTTTPPETVWNDAVVQGGAGGGGISTNWAMPSYQSAAGTQGVANPLSSGQPCHAASGNCRELPDVTAAADPYHGYVVYYTGSETGRTGWQTVGGTSAAAPLWAAFAALTDASSACARQPIGFLNPALYQLAAQTGYAGDADFNDITSGNDDYLGTHAGAYPATVAYDMASGLGSPIGAVLAHDLCSNPVAPAITSAAAASFPTGRAATFTVTTTGSPVSTLAATGALPPGVGFTDNHDGTATISGSSSSDGSYPVTITATSGVSQASQLLIVTVGPVPPTAAFTFSPSPAPANTTLAFDGTSSADPNPGGAISAYAWTFGDGATATGPTPSHAYATPGTYTVSLQVTNAAGLTSAATHQLAVIGPPTAAFAASQTSASLAVGFTDQSTRATGGGAISGWAWSFGDGSGSAAESPTHTYAAPGAYIVSLTVTAPDGQTSTSSRQISVRAVPVAAFGALQGASSLAVAFADASAAAPGDTITAWAWSFGDGAASAAASPTHTYAAAGTYTVSLVTTDSDGQTSTSSHTITVAALPTAAPAESPAALVLPSPTLPRPTPATTTTTVATRPLSIAHARISASGVISFTAKLPGAGRLVVVATVSHPRTTASLRLLAPVAGNVFARRTLSVTTATTSVTANPLAGTARVKRLHRRRAVALTLRITFTPAAGPASHAGAVVSLPADSGGRG
jgi:PKD repeat protein